MTMRRTVRSALIWSTVFLISCELSADGLDDGAENCTNNGLGCSAPFECLPDNAGRYACRRADEPSAGFPARSAQADCRLSQFDCELGYACVQVEGGGFQCISSEQDLEGISGIPEPESQREQSPEANLNAIGNVCTDASEPSEQCTAICRFLASCNLENGEDGRALCPGFQLLGVQARSQLVREYADPNTESGCIERCMHNGGAAELNARCMVDQCDQAVANQVALDSCYAAECSGDESLRELLCDRTTERRGHGSNGMSCTPNTVVGECEVCDPNGQPIKPDIEPNCPPINCGSNAGYELADEPGRTVCYEIVREASSNSVCAEIGRCATQEEYCGPMSRREALALESNPCAFMDGCTGQTPPRIESLPEGRPCNRSGECQGLGESARCSVQVPSYCPLEDAPDAMLFCDTGMDEGQRYCEYYVQPPFGGTTCESFCADLSLESCDQMNGNRRCCWNNTMPDNCATATEFFHCDGASCDGESCRDQICRCFVP